MSGHNKWSQIKHKKAAVDAKKGKAFTRIIKEITVAAREGGGDPDANSKLRSLLDQAKALNMPQENATRAIKKGTGELPGTVYESHTYEGYGPGGIAILVETLTDNKNRTVADVRHAFSKFGGSMAEFGAVNWMFEQLGSIKSTGQATEDYLLENLIEFDIRDISKEDGTFFITCAPKELEAVKKATESLGLQISEAKLDWIAKNPMQLNEESEQKAVQLLTVLEDLDDTQDVFTNLG